MIPFIFAYQDADGRLLEDTERSAVVLLSDPNPGKDEDDDDEDDEATGDDEEAAAGAWRGCRDCSGVGTTPAIDLGEYVDEE